MATIRRKQRRLWVEDFRIEDTRENRIVLRMMEDWKAERKRPTHFVRAMKLYKCLIEGDIDLFLELLIDIAPRAALKLMQRTGPVVERPHDAPAAAPNGHVRQRANVEPPIIEYTEQTPEDKIDALANSLGLDELDFG